MKALVLLCCIYAYYVKTTFSATSMAISDLLLDCYRKEVRETSPGPPLTIQTFVELIRKIELASTHSLNMRMLTASILHAIRLDGVQSNPDVYETESRIPYRATGDQFYKYKLLVDYFTFGESDLFPSESLRSPELCLLHEIISNTIDPWERGDEAETCIVTKMPHTIPSGSGRLISGCPQEKGVVKTKWGSISPGHLIAGVASALQETYDTLETIYSSMQETAPTALISSSSFSSTRLSNLWISTVSGDLGEVVMYQASSEPIIGNEGYWNDTTYPRLYMSAGKAQEMTDAELLGGIDGAVIASKTKDWLGVLATTRFSQLVDMYYSSRGISFNRTYKACNRFPIFQELLNKIDLTEQVKGAARLLQVVGRPSAIITEEGVDVLSNITVAEYKTVAAKLSLPNENCEYAQRLVHAPLEIIVILDATWDYYRTRQLLSELVDAADVSHYGSRLGVINGETGNWLTNVTESVFQLFDDLHSKGSVWPATLSLTRSLHTVISHYQNKTNRTCVDRDRPLSQVVLVLAPTSRITDNDYETSLASINTIKDTFPETAIIYLCGEGNIDSFQRLSQTYKNDYAENVTMADVDSIVNQISAKLGNMAGHLVNIYCNESRAHFEDYVTPDLTALYEIEGTYLQRADVILKFKGNDYGNVRICAYDRTFNSSDDRTCKSIAAFDEVIFRALDYCHSGSSSCTVGFVVDVTSSKLKCAETDCRYPDQIRLDIYSEWTTRSGSSAPEWSSTLASLVFMLAALIF